MQKKAFVLGIGGQDGFLISELLIKKNYLVYGFYKNNIKTYNKKIKYIKFDLNKFTNFTKYLKKYNPLEIYNFSSISTIEETDEVLEDQDSRGWKQDCDYSRQGKILFWGLEGS